MLQRKLYRFQCEQRPISVYLRDQQRWIEQARVLELEGALVTRRYAAADDDETHTWEECVRLDSIGAVSTRLAYFSRTTEADDIEVTGDCPESEQLPSQG
ncbi:MAG: DUF6679 family protein [Vulcanococcus sp.]